MTIYTIPQKMSGTGTIHDLSSEHYEREVEFPNGKDFAVVKAAYYNDDDHEFFETYEDAIECRENSEYSCEVIRID